VFPSLCLVCVFSIYTGTPASSLFPTQRESCVIFLSKQNGTPGGTWFSSHLCCAVVVESSSPFCNLHDDLRHGAFLTRGPLLARRLSTFLTRGPLLARRLSTQVLHLTRFGRPPTRVVTRMQADGAIVTKTKVLPACSPKSSGGFLLRRSLNKPEISPSPSTRRPGPLLIPLQADSSCSGLRASRQHVHAPDSGSHHDLMQEGRALQKESVVAKLNGGIQAVQ
jgi:hypothetical protein